MLEFLQQHGNELMILLLTALVLGTLLLLAPQLLRAHQRSVELRHEEHMRALEQGHPLPPEDVLGRAAGRTAALVPIVGLCAAGAVTCFLISFHPTDLFAVALAVWCVAGVVGLAAITGGVALMGRLAQLRSGEQEEMPPPNPLGDAGEDTAGWGKRDQRTG
jgi:hypothetical protein